MDGTVYCACAAMDSKKCQAASNFQKVTGWWDVADVSSTTRDWRPLCKNHWARFTYLGRAASDLEAKKARQTFMARMLGMPEEDLANARSVVDPSWQHTSCGDADRQEKPKRQRAADLHRRPSYAVGDRVTVQFDDTPYGGLVLSVCRSGRGQPTYSIQFDDGEKVDDVEEEEITRVAVTSGSGGGGSGGGDGESLEGEGEGSGADEEQQEVRSPIP